MDDKTQKALAEAQEFLIDHGDFADHREVRCITPVASSMHQLDLGTVRTLVQLAQLGAAAEDTSDASAADAAFAEGGPAVPLDEAVAEMPTQLSREEQIRAEADKEFLLDRERGYHKLKAHRFTLQDFLGMTASEFEAWTKHRTVPERVMRVWNRRS